MNTPRERYQNDPHYKILVDLMVNQINQCNYSPSELREASILASIIYEEQKNPATMIFRHKNVMDFLNGRE